ncbi:uncharacterized protein TNCV_3253751 [Trichonephila clavipes]|nr:uncharacterized protein TNCV_3253751 [Trichonephila clavipes]
MIEGKKTNFLLKNDRKTQQKFTIAYNNDEGRVAACCASTSQVRGSILGLGKVLSSLVQWVDKRVPTLLGNLNTGSLASDRDICSCTSTSNGIEVLVGIIFQDGDPFNSCQVIYSQFGLAIQELKPNDHQAMRRFVEWAQNEIAVVPDFHKRILFSDEAHFWLNDYVNKQNCRIWSEANPQVYVETPLHPEKLIVWCALWAGGILLQKR